MYNIAVEVNKINLMQVNGSVSLPHYPGHKYVAFKPHVSQQVFLSVSFLLWLKEVVGWIFSIAERKTRFEYSGILSNTSLFQGTIVTFMKADF